MDVLSGFVGLIIALISLALSIAILLAQFRLFSIDRTLKAILIELKKAQPGGPPAPESEAELAKRRAAIAEVQNSWLIK